MEYKNHQQQNITELPTATHISYDEEETIQTKSPSPTSSSLPSSSPSHHDRAMSENNNHDHDINQKEKISNNVEVGSYDHKAMQAHECVVEIRETMGRSSLGEGEVSNNGVDDEDDIHSFDEYSLSPRKKRCVQITWYVVIGAFLTAFPMFAAGIVLGIIAYSDRPRAHLLRKPANVVLSVFFFLIGVGATLLIFHYVRKRVGFWTKKREHEMVTEFSNAQHDEPSVVMQESTAR